MSVVTRITTSEELNVPFSPEEVWEVLATPSAYPEWWPVQWPARLLLEQPGLLGSEIEVRPFVGGLFRFRFEEMHEPRAMRLRFFGGRFEGPGGFLLRPGEAGSTRVRYDVDVFVRGTGTAGLSQILPLDVFQRFHMRRVLRNLSRRLRTQRQLAEARRRADAATAARLAADEAARLAAEDAKRLVAEEEARRLAAELEARRIAEAERLAVHEAERRLAAEAEAARLAGEAVARLAAQEAEGRRLAEARAAEAARIAAETAARLAADEQARRLAAELEARRLAAEEAERRRAAEQARLAAEAEVARLAAEEETRQRLAFEEAAKRAAQEAEDHRLVEEARVAEEARLAAETAARLAAEEEARRLAAEPEARRIAVAEVAQLAAEEAERRRAAEQARLHAEEDVARLAAEAAARLAAEEETRRLEAEARASAPSAPSRVSWFRRMLGWVKTPEASALEPQSAHGSEANFAIARNYLAVLSSRPSPRSLDAFLAKNLERVEYPHRFLPRATSSSVEGIFAPRVREEGTFEAETFELRGATGGGSQVAMEVAWSGRVGHDMPPLVRGQEFDAHLAVFLKLQDGRIVREHIYACFEPWSSPSERARVGAERAQAKRVMPTPGAAGPGSSQSNFEIARSYLAALNAGASPEEVAGFFAEDGILEEFPNRFAPAGVVRTRDEIGRARARDLALFKSEYYELLGAFGGGSKVAMEIAWTAVIDAATGPYAAAQNLDGQAALFLKFRDGVIVRQRSYRCLPEIVSVPRADVHSV